jgi:ketosteroid isomerase-like protein
MNAASDEIVTRYLHALQSARQVQSLDEAWRPVADLLAEDVRWRFAGGGADRLWPVEWSGRDAVLAHMRHPRAAWSRLRTETTGVWACGPVVLVEQVSTVVEESGVEVLKPVAHIFTVVEGLISEVRTYRNDARPA